MLESMSTGRSLIVDLPAELRNRIYHFVLADHPQARLKAGSPILASQSTLPRVNKQVRAEYLAILHLFAPETVAQVRNLDFRHIVTFFNKLAKSELAALSKKSSAPRLERPMMIELAFDDIDVGLRGYLPEYFFRWLRRLEHPTKPGTTVAMHYTVDPRSEISSSLLEHVRAEVHKMPSGEGAYAGQKIKEALRKSLISAQQ